MNKIEKFRKLCKAVQYGGMIIIMGAGMFFVWWFGFKNKAQDSTGMEMMTPLMITILVLFAFMVFVTAPLQSKLLKLVILESLNGLVEDVKFDRKKGYNKESFMKLNYANQPFEKYGCADYYSFKLGDKIVESTTARAYDEFKIPKQKGKKGSKGGKKTVNYFYGRIYILPFESEFKFNVLGKKNPTVSRKKDFATTEYNNEYPIKIKKYYENFEIFYKGEKPNTDIQTLLEKLLTLKIQSKGTVSVYVRNKSMVILVDNNRHYEELEFKKPIDEAIIRNYRKDVNMVINFINGLKDYK